MEPQIDKTLEEGHYSVPGANIIYMLMALIFLTAGAQAQHNDFNKGILITEYVIILLPVIALGVFKKVNFKKALKLKALSFKQMCIIFLIALLLLPTVAMANYIAIFFLSLANKVLVMPMPSAATTSDMGWQLFLIGLTPGLCEEMFFRGMVLDAYENHFNKKWAVVISAILFGVFHFNMQNFFGPIILGLTFGYLVQLTGSIWAGVLAHAVNNGTAVVLDFLLNNSADTAVTLEAQANQLNDSLSLLIVIAMAAVIASVCWIFLVLLFKALKNDVNDFRTGSQFKLRGVDYLVVSQYNSAVAILPISELQLKPEERKIQKVEKKALRQMSTVNINRLWTDPVKNRPYWVHFLPWIIVAALYLDYIMRHLSI